MHVDINYYNTRAREEENKKIKKRTGTIIADIACYTDAYMRAPESRWTAAARRIAVAGVTTGRLANRN